MLSLSLLVIGTEKSKITWTLELSVRVPAWQPCLFCHCLMFPCLSCAWGSVFVCVGHVFLSSLLVSRYHAPLFSSHLVSLIVLTWSSCALVPLYFPLNLCRFHLCAFWCNPVCLHVLMVKHWSCSSREFDHF